MSDYNGARPGFKSTVTPAMARKRRQEEYDSIRKAKRNARINERRGLVPQPTEQQDTNFPRERFYAAVEFLQKSAICGNTLNAINLLICAFSDSNPHLKEIVVETGIVEQFLVKNLAPNFLAPKIVEALARLSETQQYFAIVAAQGAIEKLVGLIGDEKEGLRRDSMTCLANILEHDDQEDMRGFSNVQHLVQGKAIFLMSNIAGGTHEQIGRMLRVHKLLEEAIWAGVEGPWSVLYEALETVVSICLLGTPKHIGKVVESDGIKILAEVLRQQQKEIRLLASVLDALDKLFEVGKTHQLPCRKYFEEYGGKENLVDLQFHPSPKVSSRACYLLEKHFGFVEDDNEDDIDENMVPAKTANDTYVFGTVAPKKLYSSPSPVTAPFGSHLNGAH